MAIVVAVVSDPANSTSIAIARISRSASFRPVSFTRAVLEKGAHDVSKGVLVTQQLDEAH